MSIILGTAGHIDHGKTSLVRYLTGTDTDRLAEEKARGITIDIGFAFWKTAIGEIAIIDVPGHERFIRNMIAGIAGIDWVIMTVAADEGVMPQTIEHLEIIDLMGIKGGVIAITKADLVDDEWIELLRDDIEGQFKGTCLEGMPIVPVSSITGLGMDDLKKTVEEQLSDFSFKTRTKQIRLNVDRSFLMEGYGQVVTGTLISGTIRKGNILSVLPGENKARVRGIQHHNKSIDEITALERTSLNLTSEKRLPISRGSIIATSDWLKDSYRLGVEVSLFSKETAPIKHLQRVRLHIGTAELLTRIRLVGIREIEPGSKGLAILSLEEPYSALGGDRFIVRFYSPLRTIGGGRVLDPNPLSLTKSVLRDYLSSLANLDATEYLRLYLTSIGPLKQRDIKDSLLILGSDDLQKSMNTLIEAREASVIRLEDGSIVYVLSRYIEDRLDEMKKILISNRERDELSIGLSKKELADAAGLDMDMLNAILSEYNALFRIHDGFITLMNGSGISKSNEREIEEVMNILKEAGISAPSISELKERYKNITSIIRYLQDKKEVVRITGDYYITTSQYIAIEEIIIKAVKEKPKTASELKDLLKTTRKHIIPILEYLDNKGITKREGDLRFLGRLIT